ncbi:MAG TPA: hypothetical protein VLE72_02330 [Candidatus Saccharimonadales bacterium]|nr:hypothetical protein [Candidatus Saccharimonadales bacterium]
MNKFFIALFAVSLSGAIMAFCLDSTILKADFVAAQADKSGVYDTLAQQLPKAIADNQSDPTLQAALTKVVTAQYLRTNIDQYLHALEQTYRQGGTVPTLDLSGIVLQVESLGVHLSAEQAASLSQKLMIQPGAQQDSTNGSSSNQTPASTASSRNPTVSPWLSRVAQSKWLLALASLVLAALVVLTATHNRWRSLGRGCIYSLAWLGAYYFLLRMIPNLASHQLAKAGSGNPLTTSVNNLVALSAAGVAQRLLFTMIGLAAVGALLFAASLLPKWGGHVHKGEKEGGEKRTPLPSLVRKKD